MAYNKFINRNGETLIDLTGDTVDQSSVLAGKTFHDKTGETLVGNMQTYDGEWNVYDACVIVANLTKVTLSNLQSVVLYGDAYESVVNADDGYSIATVSVFMGLEDITNSAYDINTHTIKIESVTSDVTITAVGANTGEQWLVTYPVVLKTTLSNTQGTISKDSPVYTSNVVVDTDQKLTFVRVKMGGVDITEDCFEFNDATNTGSINISNVTGNIEIIIVGSIGPKFVFSDDFKFYDQNDDTSEDPLQYFGNVSFINLYGGNGFAYVESPEIDPWDAGAYFAGKEYRNVNKLIYTGNYNAHEGFNIAINYTLNGESNTTYVSDEDWVLVQNDISLPSLNGTVVVPQGSWIWNIQLTTDSVVTIDSIRSPACLTGDTMLMLSSGVEKPIKDVTYNDRLLTVDEQGNLVESKIMMIVHVKPRMGYDIWTFDDETVINTVGRHRFYRIETESLEYLQTFNVGDHTLTCDGKKIALKSHQHIDEVTDSYTILCGNCNYFANKLWSGNRSAKKMRVDELKFV